MALGRLRVNYLFEDTTLFGGVKIALHQADLLTERGHEITVVSKGAMPSWYSLRAPFLQVDDFASRSVPRADVTVATFWTTITAAAAAPGEAIHYCQGFEGAYLHNRDEHEAIHAAYATPIPAMGLAPHLAELVRDRFRRPARVVPPALTPAWKPAWRWRARATPRILVVHPFENDWKGVRTALEAVVELRRRGVACRLVRLSQWPLSDAERAVLEPDEYHHHVTPPRVAKLARGCDLHLAPSWEQEGFGLPVIEAMASGVPVVASDIAAFRYATGGAADLVPFDDPKAFADRAATLVARPSLWRRRRREGLAAVARFSESAVAETAETTLRWAAGGTWRDELEHLRA